jgi:hypothetical protein
MCSCNYVCAWAIVTFVIDRRVWRYQMVNQNPTKSTVVNPSAPERWTYPSPLVAWSCYCQEEFEVTKGAIRNRISKKNRQHNGQKKKVQKNKQRSTKHTYKTKAQVTRTPLKPEGELRCSGRVSSSCSTDTNIIWRIRLSYTYLVSSVQLGWFYSLFFQKVLRHLMKTTYIV